MAIRRSQVNAQIESVKEQLVKKYGAEKVILFGSAAKGKFAPDSDLDFLVVKDSNKNFHDRVAEVYRIIEKDIAADFIVYTPQELEERLRLGDPFVKSILSEGKVLYG